ncbi:hypothetical protein [Cyclobacterium jeungdonense]|uniref:C-terminal domain of CHU protein family protein n=1 Tax=Cyclobacterium jeungdonense TaxID=708087 RepID=A0ABT8C1S5_9BACT|nr:hypothetical protein [Cyclobacterium jeungdonense]MDN3686435.1 hypothetical protein [Cyclobacterium jeungdonense]
MFFSIPAMVLAGFEINEGLSKIDFIEPLLEGPGGVCLNGGFAYADFSAGGDPITDRYIWSITDATGFEIFYESGGEESSEISFPFTSTGLFTVSLRVIRGGNQNYYQESQTVTVERGPSFVLPPDVVYCGSEPVMLQALDPVDANSGRYTIEWLNPSNAVIGTGNTYLATEPGRYYAKVSSVACEAVATTFVGPSISVNVVPSASVACLGSTVNYRPDAPYLASWFFQKNGSPEKTFIEDAFELTLDTDELDGVGAYTVYFSIEDPDRPGCDVEYAFDLEVRNAPDFTVTKLSDAESCQSPTGVIEIQANSPLNSVRIAGGEEVIINQIAAGEKRTITGLEPKIYTITASAGSCDVTRSISIENENPAEGIDFEVTSVPSTCSNTGLASGVLFLDFMGLSVSGTYRIAGENGRIYEGDFQNETRVEVEVPNGSYTVSVSDENACSSTKSQTYRMIGARQVSFSVPAELNVCQRYSLAPDTGQALSFQMLAPDGSEVALEEEGFPIDQAGTYRLIGRPEDAASTLCPRTRLIEVTVNEPLEYDVNQRIINCFGNQIFGVELFGKNPNEVIIRWMTEDRTILARELEFFPPSTGNFLLEVQPRGSSACPVAPITFEVTIPENNASAFIEGSPICGEGAVSVLKAEVTGETVDKVEWYKIDENGDNTWLFEYDDQLEMEVDEPGVYELVLRNEINCRLYGAVYEVEEIIPAPIDLANSYTLCSAENRRPTLEPGDFEAYAWYLEDSLLSESASYMPSSPGNYRLEVVDASGCPLEQAFSVEENCFILIRYPNALVPGDPQREFTVYAAPEIDRVEVFIYNRNGALIFYCEELDGGQASPACSWNGFINGNKVIDGTYSVIVNYSSDDLGIEKSEKRSLTVIGN